MKTQLVTASILITCWGTVALADQNSTAQCSSKVAQDLKSCLEKASGENAKETCKRVSRRAEEACGNGVKAPAK